MTQILLNLTATSFSSNQTTILLIIGTLAGDGPDIDLIWYYFENRNSTLSLPKESNDFHRNDKTIASNHREYPTHAPLTWLILCALIVLAGLITNSIFTVFIGLTILAGSWSHFVLDSIEFGIRWFWPFSNKRYCLHKTVEIEPAGQKGTFSYYWKMITTRDFLKSWSLYAEILIVMIAVVVLISEIG